MICDAKGRADVSWTCAGKRAAYARVEGQGASAVGDVNNVYDFFGDTADAYAGYAGVDLTRLIGVDYHDGKGRALRAAVRVCPQGYEGEWLCPYGGAFWDNGDVEEFVFGAGMATDDIAGRELTHAVISRTSKVGGAYQSAAINQGLSEAWGEIVDLTNGSKDDTPVNRWKIGEGSARGVFGDMRNPGAYGQPDKMTSDKWFGGSLFTSSDFGIDPFAVNSGVFDKAFYLVTDGDMFNGYTIVVSAWRRRRRSSGLCRTCSRRGRTTTMSSSRCRWRAGRTSVGPARTSARTTADRSTRPSAPPRWTRTPASVRRKTSATARPASR
ncbi:M4 family metallopeptidase [Actinopolymorpha sp. NPDC004070]|uniref:M4 family metallopeptidase n=1 Tax=Actinopolymorpha sp. NPDC004070 TaxID=3154548 RepID=UPI0033B498BE